MAKQMLTERKINSLRAVYPEGHKKAGEKLARGKRYTLWDVSVRGFGVRVSDKGARTFVLKTRYPGGDHASNRALGEYAPLTDEQRDAAKAAYEALPTEDRKALTLDHYLLKKYGATTLAAAREKAKQWRALIEGDIDPAESEEQEREATREKRANTFSAVAEAFIAGKLPGERKRKEVERDIRREFIPAWGKWPITDISEAAIAALITAKSQKTPSQARNLLGTAKRLFQWAVDRRAYGIKASPAAHLKPAALCGEKTAVDRVLENDELRAFWRAAKRLPYPYGPIYQLLALSGLRLNEVADAQWSEFDPAVLQAIRQRRDGEAIDWSKIDPENLIWTIPAARMKGKNTGARKARAHVVPLTLDILAVLEPLRVFKRGDFLFSTTLGESPVWMSDKIKKKLDARMLAALRLIVRKAGGDPVRATIQRWTNHDIRRTVRTGLSRLRLPTDVCEAVLAYVRPGIEGTYNTHAYLDEKREALAQWAQELYRKVDPPKPKTSNVTKLIIPLRA
jgi:integrase